MGITEYTRTHNSLFRSDIPWGAKICGFYETEQHYLELVVPFVKAGLEGNEYCIWIFEDNTSVTNARIALNQVMPEFAKYNNQICIISAQQWQRRYSKLKNPVLPYVWKFQERNALAQGYNGVRVIYSPGRHQSPVHAQFIPCGRNMSGSTTSLRMISLCIYKLSECSISDIISIATSHQFTFMRKDSNPKYSRGLADFNRLHTMGMLAAAAIHEIRNPMTSVKALMELLQTKREFSEYNQLLAHIINEINRANELINDYLSIGADKKTTTATHNLNDILEKTLPLIEINADKGSKHVTINLNPVLDFYVDERKIKQVILNLAQNGLEAMQPGGTLHISTYMQPKGPCLVIEDQGTGIPDYVLENLGTPFVTSKAEGCGLGLYISSQILASYNTKLQIDTSPDGTKITICFPLHNSEDYKEKGSS